MWGGGGGSSEWGFKRWGSGLVRQQLLSVDGREIGDISCLLGGWVGGERRQLFVGGKGGEGEGGKEERGSNCL